MEKAKKNQIDRVTNQKEQARIESLSDFIIQEEQRVNSLIKQI